MMQGHQQAGLDALSDIHRAVSLRMFVNSLIHSIL